MYWKPLTYMSVELLPYLGTLECITEKSIYSSKDPIVVMDEGKCKQ